MSVYNEVCFYCIYMCYAFVHVFYFNALLFMLMGLDPKLDSSAVESCPLLNERGEGT